MTEAAVSDGGGAVVAVMAKVWDQQTERWQVPDGNVIDKRAPAVVNPEGSSNRLQRDRTAGSSKQVQGLCRTAEVPSFSRAQLVASLRRTS
jgi:hypothetical protein